MTTQPSTASDIRAAATTAREQLDGELGTIRDPETAARIKTSIESALGPQLYALLTDDDVNYFYRNPSSDRIWINTLSGGTRLSQLTITATRSRKLIAVIGRAFERDITREKPMLEAVIPFQGARFSAILEPISGAPMWKVDKKMGHIPRLADYLTDGIATTEQIERIKHYIGKRANILIGGDQRSGKTSLTNACISYAVEHAKANNIHERFGIIEDTPEIMCAADDHYQWIENEEIGVSVNALLKASLRFGATRLCIGEIRGHASTLLEAWTTYSDGGFATIHGGTPAEVMRRLEILLRRDGFPIEREAIRQAVHAIIIIRKSGISRLIRHVVRVTGATDVGYTFSEAA